MLASPNSSSSPRSAHIVGAGLIGTSIGLALRNSGAQVSFEDTQTENSTLANDLVKAEAIPVPNPELVIIATPTSVICSLVAEALDRFPDSIVIDIGGLKSKLINEIEALSVDISRFVSVHPMAGREYSGPGAARADLFDGRAWIITPSSRSSERAISMAGELGEALGSTTYRIGATLHDSTIALVSHLPQMVSSLLGTLLNSHSPDELSLAGQGLRDTSRLAASDPAFWADLLLSNSEIDARLLAELAELASHLSAAISEGDRGKVEAILREGREGQRKIPGKHGARSRDYTYLPVVIQDAPGQLAALFDECARAEVNVEDLTIEHSPGQSTGLITLALSDNDAKKLQEHLALSGWSAHRPHK